MAGEQKIDNTKLVPEAKQREHAWPVLLMLLLVLGGLPEGPGQRGAALAGEKAGAKPAASRKENSGAPAASIDPELEVFSPPGSGAAAAPEQATPPAPADGEGTPVPEEQLPSPPENLDQIEQQAEGLLTGKKFAEAADFARENEAALAVSFRLKQILLEALIQTETPNWQDVGNRAQALLEESPADPVGNLAFGMSWANRKTPDVAKALTYLAKAKDSKRALPMTSSVYWKVWATKNWYVFAGVLAMVFGGGFAFAKSRKRKRHAEEELTKALTEAHPEHEPEGPSPAVSAAAGEESRPAAEPPVSKTASKTAEKATDKAVAKPEPNLEPKSEPVEAKILTKEEAIQAAPAQTPDLPVVSPHAAQEEPSPLRIEPPAPAAETPAPPMTPPRSAPIPHAIDLAAANLEAGGLAPSRPPHLPGGEAEVVWQNLLRQATSRPIPLDVREPAPPPPPPPVVDAAQAGDVTLDLSEASMTEDLVTKLRMLAITDGELRKLLQMRNPEHLPALVEYITMKPDPVRLAFMAREVGHYHDPAVSEILSTLLYHPDHRVALSAIQGLQINGGAESVAVVCPFLESDVPALVEAARAALTEFGPKLILDGLARLPSHPDERVRSGGVFVLSRMKGIAVSRLLVAMLGDPSAEVRRKVLLAMAYQKNPTYISTLREFVRQAPDEDKKVARKAIVFLQSLEKKPG